MIIRHWRRCVCTVQQESVQILISTNCTILFSLSFCLTECETVWDCCYWWNRVQYRENQKASKKSCFHFWFTVLPVWHARGGWEKINLKCKHMRGLLYSPRGCFDQVKLAWFLFLNNSEWRCLILVKNVNYYYIYLYSTFRSKCINMFI